jgi:hypothetical protein
MRRSWMLLAISMVWCANAWSAEPYGRIGEKYAQLGRSAGALGPAIGIEADAPHNGRLHLFKNGMIYWHPEIGEAFAVWGAISSKYWQLGRAEFGYPITDERATPDGRGRYNHFRALHLPGKPESSIYWTRDTGAFAVYGLIRDAWAKGGWERGELGFPTSDEFQAGGFRRQNFERGYITWSQAAGINVVKSGGPLNRPSPQPTFGSLLVTGIEVAVNDQVLGGNATFLSENSVCAAEHMAPLTEWLRQQALAQINSRVSSYGVSIRGDAQLVLHCTFRAEVLQACQRDIQMRMAMPKGLFKFWVEVPGPDPGFSIDFDLEASSRIQLPANSGGRIAIGAITAKASNLKFDSQNFTGDVVEAAVRAANSVHEFFSGKDLLAILTQDRQVTFGGVSRALSTLHPLVERIPPSHRIDACIRDGNVMRLNGTNAPEKGPVVN